MPPRTASELLPKPFDDLDLANVRQILDDAGEDGENLFLEWKSEATPDGLAKAAAAFANTFGGLFIAGVTDESREIVGIEPKSGEIRLWVKEILRSRVLPLPPFQARAISLPDDPKRVVLLMLIEESSTTPHLLTSRGAIYVRNPGSSDPVPIGDQGRLLDLTRRGREALDGASNKATMLAGRSSTSGGRLIFSFAAVPTGRPTDPVRRLYSGAASVDLLAEALEGFELFGTATNRPPTWTMNSVERRRVMDRGFQADPEIHEDCVTVDDDGSMRIHREWFGRRELGAEPERHGPVPLRLNDGPDSVLGWFRAAYRASRELALELGAHGDLRIVLMIDSSGRHIFWESNRAAEMKQPLTVSYWTGFDGDASELVDLFRRDLLRSMNVR